MAVPFALFGTPVEASPPADQAAVARELRARDVQVPADRAAAYAETHTSTPPRGRRSGWRPHVAVTLADADGSRGADSLSLK